MANAEVTLPGDDNSSVPAARHFVQGVLDEWGQPEQGWAAALVVTELAANAALHAGRGPFTVTVTADGSGRVRVSVTDGSTRPPRQRDYSPESTTGRGLKLIADLSMRWGVTRKAGGKIVWADLAPPGTDVASDDAVDDEADDVDALLASFPDLDDGPPAGAGPSPGPRGSARWSPGWAMSRVACAVARADRLGWAA